MRRILVDHAREHDAQKRGGEWEKLNLDVVLPLSGDPETVLALDEALNQLSKRTPRQAQVVELRCFAGLTTNQIAAMLAVSPETVKLDWRFARAWLQRQMRVSERP
jgi:RNA polymerase sigma factor (TIGR02999 family)